MERERYSLQGIYNIKNIIIEYCSNIFDTIRAQKCTDILFGEDTYSNLPSFKAGILCYEGYHIRDLIFEQPDYDMSLKRINFQFGEYSLLDKYTLRHIFGNKLHLFNQVFRTMDYREPYPNEMMKHRKFFNSLNDAFANNYEHISGTLIAVSSSPSTNESVKFFVIGIKNKYNIPVAIGILPYFS